MLGEITHLQTISEDLKSLTMDPHKLPSSSEQVGTVDQALGTSQSDGIRGSGPGSVCYVYTLCVSRLSSPSL